MTFKAFRPYEMQGRRFTRLFFGGVCYKIDVVVPDEHKLLNFVVTGDAENGETVSLLVLDPYGDDTLPDEIRKRIFGEFPYTVAIDQKTGGICVLTAWPEDDGPTFYADRWMPSCIGVRGEQYCIPSRWKKRLGELCGMKRPYRCHVDPGALEQFADREVGYDHLRQNVVFSFHFFGSYMLEVWGDSYRKVEFWR